MLSSKYRKYSDLIVFPVARLISRTGIDPNVITFLGFITSILVAIAFAYEDLFLVFLLLLMMSLFDVLDGAVAKVGGRVTRFGGFLDSTLDRYSDSAVLIGLAMYLDGHYVLILIVLIGTLLVSYTRARAENFIPKCDVGLGERAERLIVLMVATLLAAYYVFYSYEIYYVALVFLAFLTHFTVLQRVYYTYKLLR
jgi:phosphatidylglycerophosphate synthase